MAHKDRQHQMDPLKDPKTLLELYRRALEQGLSLEGRVYATILSVMYQPLVDHRVRAHMDCPSCGQFYIERRVLTEFMKGYAFHSDQEVEQQFLVLQRSFDTVFGLRPTLRRIEVRQEYLWGIRVARIHYAGHELACDLETLPDVAGTANAELASRVLLDVIFERPGQLSPAERIIATTERLREHPGLQRSTADSKPSPGVTNESQQSTREETNTITNCSIASASPGYPTVRQSRISRDAGVDEAEDQPTHGPVRFFTPCLASGSGG